MSDELKFLIFLICAGCIAGASYVAGCHIVESNKAKAVIEQQKTQQAAIAAGLVEKEMVGSSQKMWVKPDSAERSQ